MVLLEVGILTVISSEVSIEFICFNCLVKWWCTKGQNIKQDAQRKQVRFFGLKCFLTSLMNFRSHVSGGSNDLLYGFVAGGKAKVTQFEMTFG